MVINLRCIKCKSDSKLNTKECRTCGIKLSASTRKHRVLLKLSNGKRRSKIVETLDTAKKIEAKLKTESIDIGRFRGRAHILSFIITSNHILKFYQSFADTLSHRKTS